MKKKLSFILALIIAASLTGCSAGTAASETTKENTASSAVATNSAAETSSEESSSSSIDSEAVTLTFSDSGIDGEADGVKIDGTALTISKSGTYILTGSCSDGSVKVKKGTENVKILLSGLSLSNSKTAPIVCGKSSEVTIEVADSTENTLSDTAENNDTESSSNTDAENAVIKCKDGSQVVLCGSGSLTINANGKNGIKSGYSDSETSKEASLIIKELSLSINAPVNDAVNAENLLNVESGTLTIDAADDALHCDLTMNIGADGTDGPSITITNAYEGIEAAVLNIMSGDIDINCSDDCLNAANGDLSGYNFEMNISGGNIHAYTTDGDGFDSNGTMTISGGYIEVWTANTSDNQPLDADGELTVTGGTILAAGGSSGMGLSVTAENGFVTFGGSNGGFGGGFGGQPNNNGENMTPPDDNQNASGNNESMPEGTPPAPDSNAQNGQNGQSDNNENSSANSENSENGQNMPSDQPQMPQGGFDESTSSISVESGSEFTISDSDGNTLYTGTAVCNASYVFFYSDKITSDATYTLSVGEIKTESTAQTESTSQEMGGKGEMPFDGGNMENGNAAPTAPNGQNAKSENENNSENKVDSSKSETSN